MLITVIMPVRNAVGYVASSMHSVLGQHEVPLELIVVDDGSSDGSMSVVRSIHDPRVRIVAGPRSGISAAFNAGVQAASGDYVARCDADDLYTPGRLEYQFQWLEAHPDFGAISGNFATIDGRGMALSRMNCGKRAEEITAQLRRGVTRTHYNTFLTRRELLQEAGGCRTFFTSAEDIDLQLRLGQAARIWYDPLPTYQYRLHPESITHLQDQRQREFYEHTARQFLKQRLSSGLDDLQRGTPPLPPARVQDRGAGSRQANAACHEQIAGILLGTAWLEHRNGYRWQALRTGLRACSYKPTAFAMWRSLLAMMVKPCEVQPAEGGQH